MESYKIKIKKEYPIEASEPVNMAKAWFFEPTLKISSMIDDELKVCIDEAIEQYEKMTIQIQLKEQVKIEDSVLHESDTPRRKVDKETETPLLLTHTKVKITNEKKRKRLKATLKNSAQGAKRKCRKKKRSRKRKKFAFTCP